MYIQVVHYYKQKREDVYKQIDFYMSILAKDKLSGVKRDWRRNMSYEEKCDKLIEKEGIILKKVKDDKLKILRMKSII